jgi:hypothetical protein
MSYSEKALFSKNIFETHTKCPIGADFYIGLKYSNEIESAAFYEKMKKADSYSRRRILTLIEMAKQPYTVYPAKPGSSFNSEDWFGIN